MKPDSGRFFIGETVRFGYFSQDAMPCDQQMKVIDSVRRVAEYVDLGDNHQNHNMAAASVEVYFVLDDGTITQDQYDQLMAVDPEYFML